jgi:DNA-binding LacI/PurR family transcriptional regulator
MQREAVVSSNLNVVARRLEGDIRARGLQQGDRYLSVADAAIFLGVSPATAHRAMDVLVRKQLLIRQQGRGTFVGGGVVNGDRSSKVRTVHILLPDGLQAATPVRIDSMMTAVRQAMNVANVQFTFLPDRGTIEYLKELLKPSLQSGQLAGVIPISCSREAYRFLEQLGHPMVVLGSLYPDQHHLPSVDSDYYQAGYLLADYMVRAGHRQMALFAAAEGRPGDHAFYDGVSEALTRAQLPHNSLSMRIYPRDFDAFRAQVGHILQSADRPTGIICSVETFVPHVTAVAREIGLRMPEDVEVCFYGRASGAEQERVAHVETQVPFQSIALMVAEMLNRLCNGKKLEETRVVVPVVLCEPSK